MRRMCNFKKVNVTLWPESFLDGCLDIVTTCNSCFETSAEKSPQTKIYCMENSLYYLNIYVIECCLLYLAVDFFIFFNKSDGGFHWNGLSVCVFTNTRNNSAQFKDIELQLLVLFLSIILERSLWPVAAFQIFWYTFVSFLRGWSKTFLYSIVTL